MALRTHSGQGQSIRLVRVIEILEDRRIAIVEDHMNMHLEINLRVRNGKTPWPQVGEGWLIDRATGSWAFSHFLGDDPPPTITGTRTGLDPIVVQLLDAMVAQGIVRDGTDPVLEITEQF